MTLKNSSDKFTHFSNIQVGGTDGNGGGIKTGVPVSVTDAATYTVLAKNSGKIHVLPDLTADITITLPTEEVGLNYEFWYGGAAADAQDWTIVTTGNTNYYVGGLGHLDLNAGSAGDEVAVVFSDGNSNSSVNVLTPNAGTIVKVVCNGTLWYINGQVVSDTIPAFADQ